MLWRVILSQQKTKGDVSAYTSGKDELSRVFEAKELLSSYIISIFLFFSFDYLD